MIEIYQWIFHYYICIWINELRIQTIWENTAIFADIKANFITGALSIFCLIKVTTFDQKSSIAGQSNAFHTCWKAWKDMFYSPCDVGLISEYHEDEQSDDVSEFSYACQVSSDTGKFVHYMSLRRSPKPESRNYGCDYEYENHETVFSNCFPFHHPVTRLLCLTVDFGTEKCHVNFDRSVLCLIF